MPRAFNSSPPLVCRPSAETGEGRPLAGEEKLAFTSLCSKSGSAASLLGRGVNDGPVFETAFLKRVFEGSGVLLSGFAGNEAGEEVDGVFWKKPNSVLCPPEEADFFNAGVDIGVAEPFLPMVATRCSLKPLAKECCNIAERLSAQR